MTESTKPVLLITDSPGIYLAGITQPVLGEIDKYLEDIGEEWNTSPFPSDDPMLYFDPMAVSEMAGRVCYGSWANKRGATRAEYHLNSIIEHKHGSVLEHVTYNLLVRNVPRSAQLEIVRHGDGTAFSWESTRFTDQRPRFVVPMRYRDDPWALELFRQKCQHDWDTYVSLLPYGARDFETGTIARKRAKEAARDVLGGCYASDGMVTLNVRAARHIVQIRSASDAALSIREWAVNVFNRLNKATPAAFADAFVNEDPDGPVIKFRNEKI